MNCNGGIVNKSTTFGLSSFVQQMPLGGDGKAERLLPRFYANRVAVDLIRLPLDDRIGAEAFGVMQVEDSIASIVGNRQQQAPFAAKQPVAHSDTLAQLRVSGDPAVTPAAQARAVGYAEVARALLPGKLGSLSVGVKRKEKKNTD